MFHFPYRIAFLAPSVSAQPGFEAGIPWASRILEAALYEHVMKHPALAVEDFGDTPLFDDTGELLNLHSGEINERLRTLFEDYRRSEVLWLEFGLGNPGDNSNVTLVALRPDGQRQTFDAFGQAPLSSRVDECFHQYLSARHLPGFAARLPAFDQNALWSASVALAQVSRDDEGGVSFTPPNQLTVSFFLALYKLVNLYTFEAALNIDPQCPWALHDKYISTLHGEGPKPVELVRQALQLAPNFAKAHLSLAKVSEDNEEKTHSAAFGAYLIRANPFSLIDYSNQLADRGRWEEAMRLAERACELTPTELRWHHAAMDLRRRAGRYALNFEDAQRHRDFSQYMADQGAINPGHPDLLWVHLHYADALWRIGRYSEAIELRAELVEGLTTWPAQNEILRKWRQDPSSFGYAYVRDGYYRGDLGRVREGIGTDEVDGAIDLSMWIDAELGLGREDKAGAIHALYWERNLTANPVTAWPASRAFALLGETSIALRWIKEKQLGFPQERWDAEASRNLRLLACRPVDEWAQAVQHHAALGAQRLARLIARDAADFHPAAGGHPLLVELSVGGARGAIRFSPDFLAPLRRQLGSIDLGDIDELFASHDASDLALADRLSSRWSALVDGRQVANDDAAQARHQGRVLWLVAQATVRYLCKTTEPPNVIAGGYRLLLDGALELASSAVGGGLSPDTLRAVFASIEPVAAQVDEWFLDHWLLRLERAFRVEQTLHGRIAELTHGLPTVAALLRGDEQIGLEFRAAWLLERQGGADADAARLYERCLRAVGRSVGPALSRVAARALTGATALDAHLIALTACNYSALPAVNAARLLLTARRGQEAFDVLVSRLGEAGKEWTEKQIAELAPLWQAASLSVPIAFDAAVNQGHAALGAGDAALAARCYHWAACLEPGNTDLWKYLGVARARLGDFYGSLAAFGCADWSTAGEMAGQALAEVGQWRLAALALEAQSPWFDSQQPWLMLGFTATYSDQRDLAKNAYEKACQYGPIADPAHLNTFIGVLEDLGALDDADRQTALFSQQFGGDPNWRSNVLHHQAVIALGRRQPQAAQLATQALQANQRPENQAVFSETLTRAQQGRPYEIYPLRKDTPRDACFVLLENAEFPQLQRVDAAQADWRQRRALLRARRYRFESENATPVTTGLWELAQGLLSASHGTLDPQAALCRIECLRIREDWMFPIEAPPTLGLSLTRDEFKRRRAMSADQPIGEKVEAFQQIYQQIDQGNAGDPDPELFPGTPLARLSDYVRATKALQSGDPMGALSRLGIDMMAFGQMAGQWGAAMQTDPTLAAKYSKMLTS